MKITKSQIRSIITEAISDRLRMIDEAGDKAAVQAKISEIDREINEAEQIKNSIPKNLGEYVSPEKVSDMMDEIETSINELKTKKEELEDQMQQLNKPMKEAKKKPSAGMAKKEKSSTSKKSKTDKDSEKIDKTSKK